LQLKRFDEPAEKTMPCNAKQGTGNVKKEPGFFSTICLPLSTTETPAAATKPTATEATAATGSAEKSTAGHLRILCPHHPPVMLLLLSVQILPLRIIIH
jgi:hypothetical protein